MTDANPLLDPEKICRYDSFPDFLRSISYFSDDDDDFEELPDFQFTEDTSVGEVDLFDYPDESGQHLPNYPFSTIHNKPIPFTTLRTNCWIPRTDVEVKVIEAERVDAHTKLFNPNLYTIQVKHGTFQWTVKRRYKHFANLHQHLRLFRMKHKFPVPSKAHKERRQSLHGTRKVPRFPKKPDIMVRTEKDYEKRKRHLEDYLQALVSISVYRNHIETLKFFEVSHLSFVEKLGQKRKEGMVMKCSGGRHISIGCCGCLRRFHLAGRWKKRWLFLKDSYLAYVRPKDGVICDVMLLDADFCVENGFGLTGAKHGLQIVNLNRCLLAKCWTGRKADEWQAAIEEVAKTTGKDYTTMSRFQAFAPVREKSYAHWFIDGDAYFSAVADALEDAKEEIFISDWWLSPEIYMKRPITEGNKWRLDSILRRKAISGVKIFVLLYKEMTIAVNLSSSYSKHTLVNLCPENIKVLRHPDHGAGGVLLWAHHEKIVAIDQKVAFLGGLDLCYGRWDNHTHPLTDLGSITYDNTNQNVIEKQDSLPVTDDHAFAQKSKENVKSEDIIEDLNGITLNITPPSPKLGKSDSDPECVCGRERTGTNHSDKSYDNQSLEAEDMQNLIGSGPQNQTVVMATVHSDPAASETNPNQKSYAERNSSSVEASSKRESGEEEKEESDTESVKDLKKNSKPRLERMESTTEHAEKYMERESDEDIPVISENTADVYSMSAKDVQEALHRKSGKSFKAKDEKARVHFSGDGVERDSEAIFDSDEKDDHNVGVEIKGYHKLNSENQSSFRENNRAASDSQLIDQIVRSPSVKEGKSESTQETADQDKGTKRESWAMRKLRRTLSHGHERNNNININTGEQTEDSGPQSPTALNRWKLVLNVQKFQSAVKQQQQEPVPFPKEKKPLTPKISKLFHLDRSNRDSSLDLKDSLEKPALIQRTKSEIAIDELGLKGSSKLWIGKDYCNNIHKDFVDLNAPFEDFIDRYKTPRMPWHDIGAVVYGKAARDVSRHFIGRWNITKQEKCKNNKEFPLLLPKAYAQDNTLPPSITGSCHEVKTQILRSLSGWSGGIKTTECSIQTAYLHCIESAKHYIYIENQFFITRVGDKSVIKNKIGDALFNRIIRAHRNGENFRVYVVMPLLPAFEGDIGGNGGYTIRTVTHYTYTSISKGPCSLWERLSKEVLDPLKYIVFCGLRNYDELSSKLVSELVYVHSKLLIADDDTVIIGSANINDRSLLGDRDSEIAVMVQDIHKKETKFAGVPHLVGRFATSLRKSLFSEHMGIPVGDPVLDDPVCDSFYKSVFLRRATVNTSVFQKVFNCIPSDLVLSFAELNQLSSEKTLAETDPEQARNELKKIQGHIVLLPLHFMEHESSLIPSVGKEMFLPVDVWI
ncbi:phospholipase D1-like [Saccostrea echinata]|uniref:phospholipase D1-like n=1 Tax=Saccostrea echinata TaxID=191078 RepID=UPI002A819E63|nr:phospholipase D1-like [Saccostrea echinata]